VAATTVGSDPPALIEHLGSCVDRSRMSRFRACGPWHKRPRLGGARHGRAVRLWIRPGGATRPAPGSTAPRCDVHVAPPSVSRPPPWTTRPTPYRLSGQSEIALAVNAAGVNQTA